MEKVSRSKNFELFVLDGVALRDATYAGDLHAGKKVEDRASQVDGEAWSDSRGADDVDLFEHSMKVAKESVLSFLWYRHAR